MLIDAYPNHPDPDNYECAGYSHGPVDVKSRKDDFTRVRCPPVEQWHGEECLIDLVSTSMKDMRGGQRQRTATKVPGRNKIVNTAMVFIAELSRLAASASAFEPLATCKLRMLSLWAIRLYICHLSVSIEARVLHVLY